MAKAGGAVEEPCGCRSRLGGPPGGEAPSYVPHLVCSFSPSFQPLWLLLSLSCLCLGEHVAVPPGFMHYLDFGLYQRTSSLGVSIPASPTQNNLIAGETRPNSNRLQKEGKKNK